MTEQDGGPGRVPEPPRQANGVTGNRKRKEDEPVPGAAECGAADMDAAHDRAS
ncbi:MAG: hypothetical protein ACJ8EB_11930 [Allosphingosinicella sp.]